MSLATGLSGDQNDLEKTIMWKRLKLGLRDFKSKAPGERFIKTYEHWQARGERSFITTAVVIAAGLILIVGGLLLGLIPGVPGIVLGVIGLALIATRSRRMAIWLDWTETKLRALFGKRRPADVTPH